MTDPASFMIGVVAIVVFVAWRWGRWPWVKCRRCKGRGQFERGRLIRDCAACDGRGRQLRWPIRVSGGKR